jgi:hypothetical protein
MECLIAYACQTKHRQHQESHARLGSFLRGLGETKAADWWERQDRLRQGGLYGAKTGVTVEQEALDLLAELNRWATT